MEMVSGFTNLSIGILENGTRVNRPVKKAFTVTKVHLIPQLYYIL